MSKMFLFFSHKLTEEQIISAKKDLNCSEFIYLPEDLQKLWSNISAYEPNYKHLEKFKEFILKNYSDSDYVLIQGEWGYTFQLVKFCKEIGVIPVFSTTERNVTETINNDGSISKKSIFRHILYKKY